MADHQNDTQVPGEIPDVIRILDGSTPVVPPIEEEEGPDPTPTVPPADTDEELPEELRDADGEEDLRTDREPHPRNSRGTVLLIVGLLLLLVLGGLWALKEKRDAPARTQAAVDSALTDYKAANPSVVCEPCPPVDPDRCLVSDGPVKKASVAVSNTRRARQTPPPAVSPSPREEPVPSAPSVQAAPVVQVVESVVPEATIKASVTTKPGVHVRVHSETVITTTN